MHKLVFWILWVSLLSMMTGVNAALVYDLQIDPNDAAKAKVELDTRSFDTVNFEAARSMGDSFTPQLFCKLNSEQVIKLAYQEEQQCESVFWWLNFESVSELGIDLSQQQDSFDAQQGWYFLSEWNSLPRIKGNYEVELCIAGEHCQVLPTVDEAPLLIVWGLAVKHIQLAENQVNISTNLEFLFESSQRWIPRLQSQLNYLQQVFAEQESADWNFVYLSREQSSGSVSGLAGNESLLVNVPVTKGAIADKSFAHLLKISAHEALHFIVQYPNSLWANESLAEYYAQKSLFGTEYEFDRPVFAWELQSKQFPFANIGLLEANHLVAQKHLYQYYPLFYLKGAAFWHALDTSLTAKGFQLDHLVTQLEFDQQGDFDSASALLFQERLGKAKWQQLRMKYLDSTIGE
ncbi:hypothetical protein DBZ36_10190 [Alginatibacterium sediminis]|uniref:Peptidase MA-like domain-containing protein n=1 Tax=Alginatibacterium sediminis TaxID=2164068 RepID=A0A420EDL3_9ALTE|nr:hypothetical protein [Alginatibacterium sediminis]RKF18756.1 hypothetical protein DBZ36_10190 [Alginatibacterium sediminis]